MQTIKWDHYPQVAHNPATRAFIEELAEGCVILVMCPPSLETDRLVYFLTRRHIPSIFRQSSFLLLSYLISLRISWEVGIRNCV